MGPNGIREITLVVANVGWCGSIGSVFVIGVGSDSVLFADVGSERQADTVGPRVPCDATGGETLSIGSCVSFDCGSRFSYE